MTARSVRMNAEPFADNPGHTGPSPPVVGADLGVDSATVNEPHRHHYVPRLLLKGFADDDEKVWVWRHKTGGGDQQRIDNVAFERGFYSSDERTVAGETWLRPGVEPPATAALAAARRAYFSPHEAAQFRGVLERFAAAQLARTPGFRHHWNNFKSEHVTRFADEEFHKTITLSRGSTLSAKE